MNTSSGYFNIGTFDQIPCDILNDNIETKYGVRSDGIIGRMYNLISIDENTIKLKAGDLETIFSFNITESEKIKKFNDQCFQLNKL